MTDRRSKPSDPVHQRRSALSRWDNEGGATVKPADDMSSTSEQWDTPAMSNADIVQLRIRIIAIENIVLSLLVTASERQLELVREMAATIMPHRGFTQHPLTIHAATQMNQLVDRAVQFRELAPR